MNPANDDPLDEPLADLLAALDANLSAGRTSDAEIDPDLPPDQLRLYRMARQSMLLMQAAWPRSQEPNTNASQSFDLLTGTGRLGKFLIRRELGRGGSGIVFLATDSECGRDVALKLPRLEALLDPDLRQRFLEEARLVLPLNHPGLLPVYEADEIGAICYIASAYVGETTLSAWREEQLEPVAPDVAAALVAVLARGVDYLHEHHILHRDIKPSNIILESKPLDALPDAELGKVGVPRLTDFGLAKLLDGAAATSGRTGTTGGLVLGTAEYMAPEQADGRPELLSRQTDIYGLGAVLYELLAGHPPFRGRNKFDTLHQLLTVEPVRLRHFRKDIPRDLEAVCLKCLEKTPQRRYTTAGELAADLRRYLNREPTLARLPSWWRRSWKWVRQRPAGAALVAALVVIVPTLFMGWTSHRQYQEASQAVEDRQLERAWNARARGVDFCASGDVAQGVLWLARALETAPPAAEDLQELVRLDLHAWRARLPGLTGTLRHPERVLAMQFSPDDSMALTVCRDHLVRLWAADTGRPLDPPLEHPARVIKARFAAAGRAVRTVCEDGCFRTWSVATHELISKEESRRPRADRENTPARPGDLLWEFERGEPPAYSIPNARSVWRLEHGPDHATILAINSMSGARLQNASEPGSSGIQLEHRGEVRDGAFSPNGKYVATAGSDRQVRFWMTDGLPVQDSSLEHPSPVYAVAFSPSGRILATGDADALRLWQLETRRQIVGVSKQSTVRVLAFSSNGQRLGAGHGDNSVHLWKLPAEPPVTLVHPLADLPDGAVVNGIRREKWAEEGIRAVAFDPDGRRLLSGGIDNTVRHWDIHEGTCLGVLVRHADSINHLGMNPNGRSFVTGSVDKTARVWDCQSWQALTAPLPHGFSLGAVAFSPDGTAVATGTLAPDKIRIWDANAGRCEVEYGSLEGVFGLTFSPDGRVVLAGSMNQAVWYDRVTRRQQVLSHPSNVYAVAFHPRGHLFVTGGADGELHWWDAASLRCRASVTAHADRLRKAVFSPNGGEIVATVGLDAKLAFWHSRTRQLVGPAVALSSAGQAVAFRPDGLLVAVGCKQGRIHFAPAPVPLKGAARQISLWAQVMTGLELDSEDKPRSLDDPTWQQRLTDLEAAGGPPS